MGRLIAVLAVAALLAGSALASPSFVIKGDEWIGTFAVKQNGTLGGLQAAFGKPSRLTATQDGCVALWGPIGLRVTLYNLGGKNPCKPKTGYFSTAVMSGTRWSTNKGLRVGASVARLKQLYPKAKLRGAAYWLVPRFTQATGSYPGLAANVAGGKVTSFQVIYGAGGE
jgi:hypothetical protein